MGGPWRAKGFDPASWRPPAPHDAPPGDPVGWASVHDPLTAVVIGYIAAVLTSVGVMVGFLKFGW